MRDYQAGTNLYLLDRQNAEQQRKSARKLNGLEPTDSRSTLSSWRSKFSGKLSRTSTQSTSSTIG